LWICCRGNNCRGYVKGAILYVGKPVGGFIADILVENSVLLKLKAVKMLKKSHEQQLLQYLKSSGIQVGLLINFGSSVQVQPEACPPIRIVPSSRMRSSAGLPANKNSSIVQDEIIGGLARQQE
jgi:hypothetical protein